MTTPGASRKYGTGLPRNDSQVGHRSILRRQWRVENKMPAVWATAGMILIGYFAG
ncbi:MAG: hypothetical protein QM715_02845 [Nibricoccus sp.]